MKVIEDIEEFLERHVFKEDERKIMAEPQANPAFAKYRKQQ